MGATKFVNIGLTGSVKTKAPAADGLMPDMTTGTTDIAKLVRDTITFEVATQENFQVTPQDMSTAWIVGNEGMIEANLNFSTYNFDPDILVLAFGGAASDTDADTVNDKFAAPIDGFSLVYKAIEIQGDTVDGYKLTLSIPKCAIRGSMHGKWTSDAGTVEFFGQVITPEDSSGVLQPPWYTEMK